jgi:hypothetical protein
MNDLSLFINEKNLQYNNLVENMSEREKDIWDII